MSELTKAVEALENDLARAWRLADAAHQAKDEANQRWLDVRTELEEIRAGAERLWAFATWVAGLDGPNVRDRHHLTLDQVIARAAFIVEAQEEKKDS